jgi:RimJ/RimL family protein N-acetyltransferase
MQADKGKFIIETDRFTITEYDESMAGSVHKNSLDEDNRRFVPDEVFETIEDARAIVQRFLEWYRQDRAPLVYAIVLKNGDNIGYVQAVPFGKADWEIGYHIAKEHTGKGYATDALKAFLPVIMERLSLQKLLGICLAENAASCRVLEKCGFALEHAGLGNYQGEAREICRYVYHKNEEETA